MSRDQVLVEIRRLAKIDSPEVTPDLRVEVISLLEQVLLDTDFRQAYYGTLRDAYGGKLRLFDEVADEIVEKALEGHLRKLSNAELGRLAVDAIALNILAESIEEDAPQNWWESVGRAAESEIPSAMLALPTPAAPQIVVVQKTPKQLLFWVSLASAAIVLWAAFSTVQLRTLRNEIAMLRPGADPIGLPKSFGPLLQAALGDRTVIGPSANESHSELWDLARMQRVSVSGAQRIDTQAAMHWAANEGGHQLPHLLAAWQAKQVVGDAPVYIEPVMNDPTISIDELVRFIAACRQLEIHLVTADRAEYRLRCHITVDDGSLAGDQNVRFNVVLLQEDAAKADMDLAWKKAVGARVDRLQRVRALAWSVNAYLRFHGLGDKWFQQSDEPPAGQPLLRGVMFSQIGGTDVEKVDDKFVEALVDELVRAPGTIQDLRLPKTKISKASFAHIKRLRSLVWLDLRDTAGWQYDDVRALIGELEHLEYIDALNTPLSAEQAAALEQEFDIKVDLRRPEERM